MSGRPGYKITEILEIPEDWEVGILDDELLSILPGFAFKSELFDDKEGTPLIRVRDIGKNKTETSYKGPFDAVYLVKQGDILIGMDGEFDVSRWGGLDALLNQRVCRISSRDIARLDNGFLFFVIQEPIKQIERRISLTTVKHLSTKDVQKITIPLPPVLEQQKIAAILSIVGEAIQKTDEIIAKTQLLKKGLMQQLLTEGIGHTRFKETEIGEIPEEWEVVRLGEVTTIRYGLGQPPELDDNGMPMIRATNVKRGKIIGNGILRVRSSAVPRSRNPFLYAGDLIVVRSGVYTGDIGYVTQKFEGAVAGYDLIVSPSDRVDSIFLTNYLLSRTVQAYFFQLKFRAAQPHLNARQVSDTLIALASIPEQKKIASILSSVDEKLENESQRKLELEKLKKGLMQVLLTGKARVKVS